MERLRALREEKGLTRDNVAVGAGVSPVTLWRYESGQRSPNVETLEKLARAMDVEVGDFFPKAQGALFPLEGADVRVSVWGGDGAGRPLNPEAAEKVLEFGSNLVELWGGELERRIEAEDEEWLQAVADRWMEFVDVVSAVGARGTPDPDRALGHIMEINAFGHRLRTLVDEHNERCREADADGVALRAGSLIGQGVMP